MQDGEHRWPGRNVGEHVLPVMVSGEPRWPICWCMVSTHRHSGEHSQTVLVSDKP